MRRNRNLPDRIAGNHSTPNDAMSACVGKAAWASFAEAERSTRYKTSGRKRKGLKQRLFHCRFCRQWHADHTIRRGERN